HLDRDIPVETLLIGLKHSSTTTHANGLRDSVLGNDCPWTGESLLEHLLVPFLPCRCGRRVRLRVLFPMPISQSPRSLCSLLRPVRQRQSTSFPGCPALSNFAKFGPSVQPAMPVDRSSRQSSISVFIVAINGSNAQMRQPVPADSHPPPPFFD